MEDITRGSHTCEGKVEDPQGLDPSGTSGGSSPTDSSDAGHLASPPAIVAMLSLVGGAVQFVL